MFFFVLFFAVSLVPEGRADVVLDDVDSSSSVSGDDEKKEAGEGEDEEGEEGEDEGEEATTNDVPTALYLVLAFGDFGKGKGKEDKDGEGKDCDGDAVLSVAAFLLDEVARTSSEEEEEAS